MAKKTSVGGQALIEGMLMIGPRKVAIAVRKPDGEIALQVKPLAPKSRLQKIPFIRGAVNLFKQMYIGVSALMYSAEFFDADDDGAGEPDAARADSHAGMGSAGGTGNSAGAAGVAGADSSADAASAAGAKDADARAGAAPAERAAVAESGTDGTDGTGADARTAGATAKSGGQEASGFEKFLQDKLGDKAADVFIYAAVAISLCFSVGLFILLPNLIAGFLPFDKSQSGDLLISNLLEGVIRVSLFLAYLMLSSRMKEIRRVWQYHGAEHKTIHCYEHGDPLTVGNIQKYSRKHPRCGTSFLFLVMIISILVFSIVDIIVMNLPFQPVGAGKVLFSLLVRLVMIPVVAGVAYELIKLAGRHDNALTRVVSAPGLMFQNFTTKEPEDDMVEVAIVAFENALSDDEDEMAW
jgi:uncharacterized protein YqhQ